MRSDWSGTCSGIARVTPSLPLPGRFQCFDLSWDVGIEVEQLSLGKLPILDGGGK